MFNRKWIAGECRHICKACKYHNQCDLMRTEREENMEIVGGFIIMTVGVLLGWFVVDQIIKYFEGK